MAINTNPQPHMLKIVRLRNDGDTVFRADYASMRYELLPGQDLIVQYEAMCLWLGDPASADIDEKRRFRTNEFRRLCVKYGVYEKHHLIDELFPKVSVFDMAGEPLITVCQDPEGKHLTPEVQMASQNELLKTQMEQMQAQMALMQQQMQTNVATGGNNPEATIVPRQEAAGDDTPEIRKAGPITVPDSEDDDDAAVDAPRGPKPVAAQRVSV